ncbi:MAG: AAA family ATPase [Coriobacteriia bacterium]|nr:AAA family ATPase [Coriobacteriia bacterium]
MIEKVVSIANVGKLSKHDAKGDQAFRRLTIIYGDNAIGKTTLAAILDSLRENSSNGVVGRRTLGSKDGQSVRIMTSAGMRTFADGAWDDSYPLLEVFNSDFVSRVVYSGDYVTNDHQKNLCSLLVGRTAVTEGKRLEELRAELNAVNARLREVESGIKLHIKGSLDVDGFTKLPAKENVDALLDAAKRRLAAAENLAAVLAKTVPERTELPQLDRSLLEDALARTGDCISADALARITRHRDVHMDGKGEQWLRDGMQYVKDDHCPFCDQSLGESDFFEALKQYFSDAYKDFECSLRKDLGTLLGQSDPSALQTATERLLRQRAVALTWVPQVAAIDSAALSEDVSRMIKTAIDCSRAVREAVDTKQGDPLTALDLTNLGPHLDDLTSALDSLKLADAQVGAAMREIAAFVESAKGADIGDLRREVELLENQRARHDAAVASLCKEYLDLVVKKEEVTGAGKAARTRMNQSMEALLAKYKDEMNGYLSHFGSAIRIENPRTNHQTKPPSVEYSISIDGTSIALGKPAAPKDVPCFGNTLSDGEKNLFALALFLAHVKNRPDLDKVVVVFDDPVNSLDQERRLMIADTLLSMLDDLAQVVVLTHEPRLAHMLYRSGSSDECKMLCIRREGQSSCLRDWDTMDRDLATDYFRNYFTIADFLEGKAVGWEFAARSLRPFLEDYLRQRFPGSFAVDEWLGQMADRIDSSGPEDPLDSMKPRLSDIRLIAKATNPRHHGSSHAPGAEQLTATSTEIYARKALSVVSR